MKSNNFPGRRRFFFGTGMGDGGHPSSEAPNVPSLPVKLLVPRTALADLLPFGGRFDFLRFGACSSGGVIGDTGRSFTLRSKTLSTVLPDLALEADEEVELETGIGRFGVTIAPSRVSGKEGRSRDCFTG